MNNRKLNPNDTEFLRPLTERPDLEPDSQFVNDLRRRLQAEAIRTPKSGRIYGFGIAAITIFTAFASLFLLLNVANNKPEQLTEGEPGEPPAVTAPAELGKPMEVESSEQVIELFSVNYGTAEGELGFPQKMKGGSDLTPMSFFVKDDVFYILDNAGKKVVVTDGTEHLLTIQLNEDSWLVDLFVDDDGMIYVLDQGRFVFKYDQVGKLIDSLPIQQENFISSSLSVNSEGDVFVIEGGSRMLNLSTNETSPYFKEFGKTKAKADVVSETAGRLTLIEEGEETLLDIPYEHSFGSLIPRSVNSSQIIYEKSEVLQREDFSLYVVAHLIVAEKTNGDFLGAVRIPLELWEYYAEHSIRVENNEIYFMSPEKDGVHFYQLKPGSERVEFPEPEPIQQDSFEKEPSAENEVVKPYLTEDFLNQLRDGGMPGAPVEIGSSLSDMEKQLGKPNSVGELEGGYLHDYGTYQYIQPVLQDTIIGILMVIEEDGVTGEDFVEAWGEPSSEGPLVHPYEAYSMTYQLNENTVVNLETDSGRKDIVKYIQLTKFSTE